MAERIDDGSVPGDRRDAGSDVWLRPEIIAGYMRLLFNAVVMTLVVTLVVKFMVTVRDDVRFKLHEDELRELRLIEACRKSYEQNECSPESRVPALEESCDEWFQCMNRAQYVVPGGRSRYQSGTLWARTVAEILNSFVEPISIRSVLLTVSVVCAVVLVTNSAFGSYRIYHYNRSPR
ncbi:hypothetical protein HG537_0D00290 [Torulaspora globosa]|uniref:Brl1/Brr6 domain-containing protein n=1 Tax=Torulaspora globosa TaxID=48254 RepID=A0A7H9HRU5_9SACH|nr:hypothetical protein HG537_0D00290 [Torulaspora sp. CBS 2947]